MSQTNKTAKPSLWQVFRAVSASMFGVQSAKNYQADFATGSVMPFVIVGIICVVIFVLSLVMLVNYLV